MFRRAVWQLVPLVLCAGSLGHAAALYPVSTSEDWSPPPAASDIAVPLGLAPIPWPADNPYSPAKWTLGRALYFDPRLSADGSVACSKCHDPGKAFVDHMPVSSGIRGQKGGRSAPTIINRAYGKVQFWDGRAVTLEQQALGPMANPIEMGHSVSGVVKTLESIPAYGQLFAAAFGSPEIHADRVAKAIATFERTVLSGNSAYDRYKAGDKKALNAAQIRGLKLFQNKARCAECHEGPNFTDEMFHNTGHGLDKPNPDEGRSAISKNKDEWGAFKTPTLRDVQHTGPYMHDGSLKTLDEVVEFYDKGGILNPYLDKKMKVLHLTSAEKRDIVEFLHALNGEGWQHLTAPPALPGSQAPAASQSK